MPTPNPPPANTPEREPERSKLKVLFNWEDWLPYLDEFDATEAEKRQFIETMWQIIRAFVDLGWEVGDRDGSDPESLGQVFDLTTELRAAVVQSKEKKQVEEV